MNDNQLVGLPTTIQRLTKLKELSLVANKLKELPAEVCDLRELTHLYVGGNPLNVDAIRCALKLKKKGVYVAIDIAGELSYTVAFRFFESLKEKKIGSTY